MEMLYVASPLRGDVEQNIENATRYCAHAVQEGYIPIAPHVMYQGIFNDEIPEQRAAALEIGQRLLENCTRMWVCGDCVSEGMRGEIALANSRGIPVEEKPESYFLSGRQEPPIQQSQTIQPEQPLPFRELRAQTEQAVSEKLKTAQGFGALLTLEAKHHGYSAVNAAAIQRQKPDAQFTLPYHEWKKRGCKVTDFRHGMKVWTPVQSSVFEREGKPVGVGQATPQERAAIQSGALEVKPHISHRISVVYDIAQTDCPKSDYEQVMATPYSHLDYTELYDSLKSTAQKCGFTVEDSADAKLLHANAVCEGTTLTVNSLKHPAQKLAGLADALSQGIVEQSSSRPAESRQQETAALSFLLQSRLGIPDSMLATRTLPTMTDKAESNADALIPESLGRVSRMLRFTENGLQDELHRRGLDVEAPGQTNKEQALTTAQKAVNRNFTQEL